MGQDSSAQVYSRMTWDEKRHLLVSVFGGTQPDGKKCGVYVNWHEDKDGKPQWTFSIRGILPTVNAEELFPVDLEKLADRYDDPAKSEWTDRKRRKAGRKHGGTRSPMASPTRLPRRQDARLLAR
jgi:hypothetical protein